MRDEDMKDVFDEYEEDYELLDTVDVDDERYFVLIPATDSDEIDGEVFIMKLVPGEGEDAGEDMLELVEDDGEFDKVYDIFKKNNTDEFEFLD